MGLWQRITTLFRVKANKVLDRAENPAETLDYSYQRQLEMLQKVKRGVADVVTAKKRLQLQTQKLEQSVVKLDGQARQALAGGREDLARTALERKALVQGQLRGLDDQIARSRRSSRRWSSQEQEMSAKVDAVPHPEGGHQGAVLRRRGPGADRRGHHRPVRGAVRRRRRDRSAPTTRSSRCRPARPRSRSWCRAARWTICRRPAPPTSTAQIAALSADAQVESEMAQMRAELAAPAQAGELPEGQAAEPAAPEAEPETEGERQE